MKLDLTTDVVKVKFDVSLPAVEQTQNRVYKEYKLMAKAQMKKDYTFTCGHCSHMHTIHAGETVEVVEQTDKGTRIKSGNFSAWICPCCAGEYLEVLPDEN